MGIVIKCRVFASLLANPFRVEKKADYSKRFIEFICLKAYFCNVLFWFKVIWAKSGRSSPMAFSSNDSNIRAGGYPLKVVISTLTVSSLCDFYSTLFRCIDFQGGVMNWYHKNGF
jgi:hypothetical protein